MYFDDLARPFCLHGWLILAYIYNDRMQAVKATVEKLQQDKADQDQVKARAKVDQDIIDRFKDEL